MSDAGLHSEGDQRADHVERRAADSGSPGGGASSRKPRVPTELQAAESNRNRLALLADVSRRLAQSLDYETTLATVADLSLPYRDTWCLVDVLGDDGSIRRMPARNRDPAMQSELRALHDKYPPRPNNTVGAAAAIRTGRPYVEFDLPEERLSEIAFDADHLERLKRIRPRGYVSVPMIARGTVLGALTFVTSSPRWRFTDADVALVEDVANRAAMAIDNARLHMAATSSTAAREAAVVAAEDAGRRKSEFLATMSHEFRTPLNAILGYAQILDMGVLGPATPAQHAHLERLQASARHLLQLVEDVLDVAKIDADRLDVRQDALIAGASVTAAISLVHPQATAKGIKLLDDGIASPALTYTGDEQRVRQILVNLLSNAVKWTPSGGEVRVHTGATSAPDPGTALDSSSAQDDAGEPDGSEKSWAFFRIVDTGPGIPPAFMSQLFEPFVQADAALTRVKGGTGLGLAISRRLARRMGGDLTARSKLGAGATFTLWLPMIAADTPIAASTGQHPVAARRTPSTTMFALIADGASLDDAAYEALHAIGTSLSKNSEYVAQRWVAALRADGKFPGARELSGVQLRDHATPYIGLLASQLTILGESRGRDPELLGDSGYVQRLMAELHGAQRHRLGWSEADIEREMKLLYVEIERSILSGESRQSGVMTASSVRVATGYAVEIASRVLDQSTRTSVRSFRFAKSADAP